jgi:hypothetical protein
MTVSLWIRVYRRPRGTLGVDARGDVFIVDVAA